MEQGIGSFPVPEMVGSSSGIGRSAFSLESRIDCRLPFQLDLGVASLGVAVTTMEDVFLKVGEMGVAPGKALADSNPSTERNGVQSNGHAKSPTQGKS